MTVTTTASSPTEQPVDAPPAGSAATERVAEAEPRLVEEDLLVEDVSIDGMCGVY
jgi:mycofactocin precursor